jgi:uncharacterized lipoprotein YmbA
MKRLAWIFAVAAACLAACSGCQPKVRQSSYQEQHRQADEALQTLDKE